MFKLLRLVGIGSTSRKSLMVRVSVPQGWLERMGKRLRRRKEERERMAWMEDVKEKVNKETKESGNGHINR